jgi:hypothetical protein
LVGNSDHELISTTPGGHKVIARVRYYGDMEVAQIALVSGIPFIIGFIAGFAVRATISRAKRKKHQGF